MSIPQSRRQVVTSERGTLKISRVGSRGNLLLVVKSRPRLKNAMNSEMFLDLVDILKESARDDTVVGIVLTGVDSYFGSGADLREATSVVAQLKDAKAPRRETLHIPAGRFMMAVLEYPKLLAAAVQGPTVGIAATMLWHFDLVWMSRQGATVWTPFARLALVPELGSSNTMVEALGLSKANELLLLGEKLDASEAHASQLCSRVLDNQNYPNYPHNQPSGTTGDVFPNSLSQKMVEELDRKLLSLPLAEKTVSYFINLMRGPGSDRFARMREVILSELEKLDERFNSGQVYQAATRLKIGSQASGRSRKNIPSPQSKL